MRSSTCFLGQGWSYCGWCSTFWGGCICGRPVRTARGGWGYRSEDCRDEGTQEAASPSRSRTPVTLFSHMASLPACTSLEWKKKGVSEASQHYCEYLWTVPTFSSSHVLWWKENISVDAHTQRQQHKPALQDNFHHTCVLGLNQSKMKAGNPYANHFTPTAVLSEEINSPHICIVSYCIARRLLLVLWQANELEAKASAHERADMGLQPPCFSGECHAESQLFPFHMTA